METISSFMAEVESNSIKCILLNFDSIDWKQRFHLYKILVPNKHKKDFIRFCDLQNYTQLEHPKGKKAGYRMLYQISEPRLFKQNNTYIEVWDQLCCLSYFQNCWLPLDKVTNDTVWDDIKKVNKITVLSDVNRIIFNITNSFFTEKSFKFTVKEYLKNNLFLLDEKVVQYKLKKEFFDFTEVLIGLIRDGKYDTIFSKYSSFIKY